jgi:hypothetical protein
MFDLAPIGSRRIDVCGQRIDVCRQVDALLPAGPRPCPVCLTSLPRSTIWRRGSMIRRFAFITLRAKGEARSICKRALGGRPAHPRAGRLCLAMGQADRAASGKRAAGLSQIETRGRLATSREAVPTDIRFAPTSGGKADVPGDQGRANNGHCHLFDDFVRTGEQGRRHGETDCFRRF